MRSVVVVLPASMWAMIPMFRVFSSVYLRGIGSLSSSAVFGLGLRAKKRALRARMLLRGDGPRPVGYVSRVSIRKQNRGPSPGHLSRADHPRAATEYSRGSARLEPPDTRVAAVSRPWVPGVLLAVLVLAAGALIVAEFVTFAEVRVITAVPPGATRTGGAHHGYALAVIGVAMIPLAVGAVRGR